MQDFRNILRDHGQNKYTNILHIYVINVDVRIQCWHHPEQASYQLSANHSVTPGIYIYIYKHTMYTNGIYIMIWNTPKMLNSEFQVVKNQSVANYS